MPRTHCFALALLLLTTACTARAAEPPNVIVIFTDDQGSIDAGCYGAEIETPAIDRLAARGVRFTQFYAAAPLCSPSRAGLLTGRYPWLAGMASNAGAPPSEAVRDLRALEQGHDAMADQITMAEMFQAAGYATAQIGKWHVGDGPGARPLDQGFDYAFGHLGGCIDNYSHTFYWNGPNRHDLWENHQRVYLPGQFFPDLMVQKATAFIEQHRDEPFFLYFAMNAPHYPYQGEPAWLEHYQDVPYPRNLYSAFVSTLDERIGKLLDVVERQGLAERTIIVFQSDHGHSTEERAHHGGGDNGPYRGAKGSVFEGGLRVPAIVSWPGRLPQGEVRSAMAHGCDWFPTLAQLCNVPLPDRPLHGKSLVEVIRSDSAASPHEVLQWRLGKQWAIRAGSWKLMHQPRSAPGEAAPQIGRDGLYLVNLADDVGEAKNLAGQHPNLVEKLRAQMQQADLK